MTESASTIEYENLEQKYVSLKRKYKRSIENSDTTYKENQTLKKKLQQLEQDYNYLETQLRNAETNKDNSESDVSSLSTAHAHQNENIALLLQSKNQQLSELLSDIEETEKDNVTLRNNLNDAKIELEQATKEISTLSALLESKELVLRERNDELEKHMSDIRILHDKIDQYKEEKGQAQMEFNDFAKEIGKKIDQWKLILDNKNAEIDKLKTKTGKPMEDEDRSRFDIEQKDYNLEYVKKLRAGLEQAEAQIARMKSEMKDCTKEVTESAQLIEKLKNQNNAAETQLKLVNDENDKLKEQLRKSHSRCRKFQTTVESTRKINEELEAQLLAIHQTLKEKGQINVADALKDVQKLTVQNLLKEKRIIDLVQDINELQESMEKINLHKDALRESCNGEGDGIDLGRTISLRVTRDESKLLERAKKDAKRNEEENINLKLEILNLNKELAKLKQKSDTEVALKTLSDENEALRKGLHEILGSVQRKQESSPREIKSEVLEQLLRVLDVKHVSGWYHPAMRLQAELHNLEGINSELREQLRLVRSQVEDLKQNQDSRPSRIDKSTETDYIMQSEGATVMNNILTNGNQFLEGIKVNMLNIIMRLCESSGNPQEQLERDFVELRDHIYLLHDNCNKEKQQLVEEVRNLKETKWSIQSEVNVEEFDENELRTTLSLEREKVKRLIAENAKLEDDIAVVQLSMDHLRMAAARTEETLLRKLTQRHLSYVTGQRARPTMPDRKELDDCLVKYRRLLKDVEVMENERTLELAIVAANEENLRKENAELKEKLLNLPQQLESAAQNDTYTELRKRVTAAEEQGVSEKHRANHMTNLYDLVKEQLRKSEERQTELLRLSENLTQKNVLLQEQVKNLQDELVNSLDAEGYKELREDFDNLAREREDLMKENLALKEAAVSQVELLGWDVHKEQQLLDLKHQIVDLAASTDDKYLIHRLHSDLDRYKKIEKEWTLKFEVLARETETWKSQVIKLASQVDDAAGKRERDHESTEKRIGLLQDIIKNLRLQYFGSVPLAIDEILTDKITALNREKIKLFRDGREIRKMKCGLAKREEVDLIQFLEGRIESEAQTIAKLEHELLSTYKNIPLSDSKPAGRSTAHLTRHLVVAESFLAPNEPPLTNNMYSQTEAAQPQHNWNEEQDYLRNRIRQLENQIKEKNEQIIVKDSELGETRRLLNEERSRTAALDQKVQNLQYESTRKKSEHKGGGDGKEPPNLVLNEQIVSLKAALASARENVVRRDMDITKYQNLLKEDRDKHSSAAATLQKELKALQKALMAEQQKNQGLEQMECQKSSAIEKYVQQVHVLESHLAELHTRQAQADAQLHAAQQEASRWRQMAHDRLIAMEDLGKDLDEKHQQEMSKYRSDYQKLINMAKDGQAKNNAAKSSLADPEVLKLFREKDEKIKELSSKLKQLDSDADPIEAKTSGRRNLERSKEIEIQRKKYDSVLQKNKSLLEENRALREQLSKRQMLLQHRPGNATKGQLQNKITLLQAELDQARNELAQQQLVNERHKLNAADNFDKWKKQKYWQENCEKYKTKLQEQEEQLAKSQQTCSGYKLLIDRLEREKLTLESKLRSLKSDQSKNASFAELVSLRDENSRLNDELCNLLKRFEGVQQGAGALGAAIMQEKLEAQERKIAVLELSGKGSTEVRNEMERLHLSVSNLQKTNLCLEAENLELKMDLEKHSKETPYLQEQIQHLESYIEVLKNESKLHDSDPAEEVVEDKKVSQLERTVFILKRVVEKLQVENKRLTSGKGHFSDRSPSAEKFKKDYVRLKEQYAESLQKINQLQVQANLPQRDRRDCRLCQQLQTQLNQSKTELTRKSQLLDKVKALLHAAAEKERQLIDEIRTLTKEKTNSQAYKRGPPANIPSPIEELSEEKDTA
ncbi:hypothetical protein GWI33_014130 [Rhynchophorus ferrugineus]|uniref:Centrosomal protein of 290kDa coiled-coil region domain-containing protein n=1 Tax=Rhynchophorus ferrugineus TaxID=354439 RepID=A0A834M9D8_RHYFE|nr:hypothetical protein GWI33_014130 [Rhynchophorus ferrugineus]